jgi:hypothetical protein
MNAKNTATTTATTTKSRITKRIGQLAIAAVAATALALGSAPSAHALTALEAFDKLPSSCTARVSGTPQTGPMVEFFCPGPPLVIVVCVKHDPCEAFNRVRKSGLYDAKAPTGLVTSPGKTDFGGVARVFGGFV